MLGAAGKSFKGHEKKIFKGRKRGDSKPLIKPHAESQERKAVPGPRQIEKAQVKEFLGMIRSRRKNELI